jgi:hypothetical protein
MGSLIADDEVGVFFLLVDAVDGLVRLLLLIVGGLGFVLVGGDVQQVDLHPLRREGFHLEVPDELEVFHLGGVHLAIQSHDFRAYMEEGVLFFLR